MEKQVFYRIVEFLSNGLARIQEKFLKSKKKNISRTKKRFLDVKKSRNFKQIREKSSINFQGISFSFRFSYSGASARSIAPIG